MTILHNTMPLVTFQRWVATRHEVPCFESFNAFNHTNYQTIDRASHDSNWATSLRNTVRACSNSAAKFIF